MPDLGNFGLHLPLKAQLVNGFYALGFRHFQIFIGSPQSTPYSYRDLKQRLLQEKKNIPTDVNLYVHSPYWYKWTADNPTTWNDFLHQIEIAAELGVRYYVSHPGAMFRLEEMNSSSFSYEEREKLAFHWIQDSIEFIAEKLPSGMSFLLENSAGSRANSYFASVSNIIRALVIADKSNIGMCFDTEHAYANGEDYFTVGNPLWEQIKKYARLYHLNPIPQKVAFGGHKDRHTDSGLEEGKPLSTVVLKEMLSGNTPFILERDPDLVKKDFDFLLKKISAFESDAIMTRNAEEYGLMP